MTNVVTIHNAPLFPVVSLFSGAMGLDLGLMKAGLHVAVSQDYDRWCVETIRHNGHVAVGGDIRDLVADDPQCGFLLGPAGLNAEDVFAVVGGPPCQSFSTAGKRKGVEDARGQLFEQFVHVVKTIRPRFFVMENVKGLASMPSDPLHKLSKPSGGRGFLLSSLGVLNALLAPPRYTRVGTH